MPPVSSKGRDWPCLVSLTKAFNMRLLALSLLLPTLLVAAAPAERDSSKDEMKKFQGRWVPDYVEGDGKPIPKKALEELKECEAVVEGDKVILKEDREVKKGWNVTFKIDPTKNPKTIDISFSIDNGRPKTVLGIYKFEDDTLKISVMDPDKPARRPTEFTTKAGSANLLWHFKRK